MNSVTTERSAPSAFRRAWSDATVRFWTYVVLCAALLMMLMPLFWMLGTNLKTSDEIRDPLQLVPHHPQWSHYPIALGADPVRYGADPTLLGMTGFRDALANTVVVTLCSVIGQVLSCSLVGYGFAKFRLRERNVLFLIMLGSMMLPPQVTMIPVFILFRHLGLVDRLEALVIPAWFGAPFFIFMFRQFFASVPHDIMEAARVVTMLPCMVLFFAAQRYFVESEVTPAVKG